MGKTTKECSEGADFCSEIWVFCSEWKISWLEEVVLGLIN